MKNQLFSWGRSGRPEGGLGFPRCSLPLVCYVLLRLVYWYSVCWGLVPALKLEGLYDAIAEGLRTPGLKERLEGLEARLKELGADLEAPAPSPVRLHPGMAEAYRKRVGELSEALRDPELRVEALEISQGLITRVTVTAKEDGVALGLEGSLSALIGLGQGAIGTNTKSHPKVAWYGSSMVLVAGARSRRTQPELRC
ncbi:hypothetical protein NX862_05055 [Rhodobacter sp. KR11]|uniref:hypothetical protein n=1 Tax=Rhodobacter sp. KR11 TaxID=2974588 RepID=UPI0022232C0D|nr:hypothetical protein [Rhodobacter sp. KR11]MCW1918115.1 hypothetical protein [Rhodobacter sp. KR11]